jgi:sugar phosphate isomerase/epimerase
MTSQDRRRFLLGSGLAATSMLAHQPHVHAAGVSASPRRFQLGIVTYNVAANWDLATTLKVCKNVGLAAVEFRTTHKHGVEPSLTKEQRLDVKKQCADAGIVIWGCGTVCEFHDPSKAVVDKNVETCKQFVDLVADLGGKGVKVRPNALPSGVPVEKTLEQIGKALIPCGQAAANAGVEIWVEVHGRGTDHPPNVKTIMEHCGLANVGVTWNSNNADVLNGSITPYFELLRPWLKSCHVNELHSKYPYRELFTRLREMGYDRYTLAEIQGMPDVASGERLMRFYKALWEELSR